MADQLPEQLKPVNLGAALPNRIPNFSALVESGGGVADPDVDIASKFQSLISENSSKGNPLPVVSGANVDFSGRYPLFYTDRDNEEMYAQTQTFGEKAYNGIAKFTGVTTAAFLNGTVGVVNGIYSAARDWDPSSFWKNSTSVGLNDWTKNMEDSYAHYKTLRERNGSWWEPENLFTGNMFFDNIVKNLGYTVGSMGAGVVWGGALGLIGKAAKLSAYGAEAASVADGIIAEGAMAGDAASIASSTAKLDGALASYQSRFGKALLGSNRGVVAATGTAGEAGFEALNNSQDFRQRMIDQFKATRGYAPTEADLKTIDQYANSVGNYSWLANTALLTATNYIQLPKIFSSTFKGERSIANTMLAEGKWTSSLADKGFGKFATKAKNIAGLAFAPSEAFEEGAQFAIQTGTQNYFDKKYKGKGESILDDGIKYGISQALTTDEGLLNIFLGGFSGGMAMAYGNVKERGFTGYGGQEAKLRNEALGAWKESMLGDKLKASVNDIKIAEAVQEERKQAIIDNDIQLAKDKEFDYAHTFIRSRLRYNAKEAIDAEIADLKQRAVTDEGFIKLQTEGLAAETDTKEAFLNRLEGVQQQANDAAKLKDALDVKYKGIIDPATGKRAYSDATIEKLLYAGSKISDYNRRIPQLDQSLASQGISTSKALTEVVQTGKLSEETQTEVMAAIQALSENGVDSDIQDALSTDFNDMMKLGVLRKKFLEEYNNLKTTPEKFDKMDQDSEEANKPVDETAPKEVVTYKGEGEEEATLDTNEEYYIGTVAKNRKGKSVYSFKKFTVLGENEDGTIRIKTDEGNIESVDKTWFTDNGKYLGKTKDVQADDKKKFYLNHINNIYSFNFGKDKGGEVTGRLRYSEKEGVLEFVYLDKRGKEQSIEVTGDQFNPKPGYKNAIIQSTGILSPVQKESQDAFVKSAEKDPRVLDKIAKRAALLETFFDEMAENLAKTKRMVQSKTRELNKTREKINSLRKTVEGPEAITAKTKRVKATIHTAIQNIASLTKMQEQLNEEIKTLEAEQEQLEINLEYVTDLASRLDEMPADITKFYGAVKQERNVLKETILEKGKLMNALHRVMENLEAALQSLINQVMDLIGNFETKYPGLPMSASQISEFLTYFKGKPWERPSFMSVHPELIPDLQELDATVAYLDEIQISPKESAIEKTLEDIIALEGELGQLEKQLIAVDEVGNRLRSIYNEYLAEKKETEDIKKNKELKEQALGTVDNSLANVQYDKAYNPNKKKATAVVPNATIAPSEESEGKPLAAHHVRANLFGAKLETLPSRAKLQSVYVTKKNEAELGLSGLMDNLKGDAEGFSSDDTIAVVMVQMVDGKPRPVGLDGEVLETPSFETAIFQVKPTAEKLGDLFRDEKEGGPTKDQKDFLVKEYRAWRTETLANPSLTAYPFEASFGIPVREYSLDSGQNKVIDYNATTDVVSAGLVTSTDKKNDLSTKQLVTVPTTEGTLNQGTTSYANPVGKPFLTLPNGNVPLKNRNLTKAEANTIYQALLRLAMIKDFKSDEAVRLMDWLRTIVYWGVPKNNPGYSSLFFNVKEDGTLALFVSGKGTNIPFTTSSIKSNKVNLLTLLEGMYNNTNSRLVDNEEDYRKPYEEITSVSEDGTVQSVTWKNYQTYLLSAKNPDGSMRKDIPLKVAMRPITGENEANREGIYFIVNSNADRYAIPEGPAVSAALTPVAPTRVLGATPAAKQAAAPAAQPTSQFKFDGEAENTVMVHGKPVKFIIDAATFDEEGFVSLDIDKPAAIAIGKAIGSEDADAIEEEAGNTVYTAIYKDLKAAQAPAPVAAPVVEPVVETPVVETPAASTEPANDTMAKIKAMQGGAIPNEFRVAVNNSNQERYQREDWKKFENWLKTTFPNVPVYRVKNVIQATNGQQAWGMFKNGAIYVYENAEVGTGYHEVFEAVWKMFSDKEERANVINEFKQRNGSFVDRPTGRKVNYKDATDQEVKEQLAEEFRDYVLNGKIPAKPTQGRPFIVKLFADLVNFIKEFFTGNKAQVNTANLFDKIGRGYYKQYSPYESKLAFAKEGIIDIEEAFADSESDFRVAGFTSGQEHDIMQEMTYLTLAELTTSNKSLFNISDTVFKKAEHYTKLKTYMLTTLANAIQVVEEDATKGAKDKQGIIDNYATLFENIDKQWPALVERHAEYLVPYNIEFDESDNLTLKDEDNSGKETYQDANKIDAFRKANSAVKLLLSTVPRVDTTGKPVLSSVGGHTLIPYSEISISLMNKVASSRTVDDMIKRIAEMAENDIKYKVLYQRITRSAVLPNGDDYTNPKFSLNQFGEEHEVRLINTLWRTFKKNNPDVLNLYVLDNGDVQVGDSNFTTAAAQVFGDFQESIIESVRRDKSPFFVYSADARGYVGVAGSASKPLGSTSERVAFLKKLGIPFTVKEVDKLNGKDFKNFEKAVNGIRTSINEADKIATISGKTVDITGRLKQLAEIRAKIDNPEFSSTYFNINGERVQVFIGTNANSDLYDALANVDNLDDLAGSQYGYLLTDSFAQGSVKLNAMFDPETRERISGAEQLLKSSYADGTVNSAKGKRKSSSKLTYKERLVQQMNMMLEGYYPNLVPGDASMEQMVFMGNEFSVKDMANFDNKVMPIFREYFLSEVNLSKEDRPVARGNASDLRFFKPILGNDLHADIVKAIKEGGSADVIYKQFESRITKAVKDFVADESANLTNLLEFYGILTEEEGEYNFENIAVGKDLNADEMNRQVQAIAVNFMINNIELHKLLYSDPYQYTDELKRIKNFISPRQAIISQSPAMNSAMDSVYNKGYSDEVDEDGNPVDIGNTNFLKDSFTSITFSDVNAVDPSLKGYIEEAYKETDGGGVIIYNAYRNFRIRAGEWNDLEEKQYRYDIAWEKMDKGLFSQMSDAEQALLDEGNPQVKSAYTPIKPIVSGNKANGRNYNDVMLDKFALYPLSYRIQKEINSTSNAIKLYDKMQKENIDYAVFSSSRKVGAEETNELYNPETGEFVNDTFKGLIEVPFAIMSIQSEVPSKDTTDITRGSQVTKLITLDLMQAGVPVDFKSDVAEFADRYKAWYSLSDAERMKQSELYTEIVNNQKYLELIMENGFNVLLDKLGITVNEKGDYQISDVKKIEKTLRDEILKREVNDNITDALTGFLNGDVVLEATPAYQQIRNILYSIADKNVMSPTISGGMKVQISPALLESVKAKAVTDKNGKTAYVNDTLDFYELEEGGKKIKVCEIMVGRWFDTDMSDEALLDYLNNTDEGKKILSGLAYRIPSQKQNSIDVFRIKKFLPKEFGDSVVIPSQLVNKAGSDFDIDKLNIYLKSLFVNAKGKPELIQYKGSEQATKDYYAKVFDELSASENFFIRKQLEKLALQEDIDYDTDYESLTRATEEKLMLKQEALFARKDRFIENAYRRSLENEYIQSTENLASHPANFEQLVKPNSSVQFQELSNKIVGKLGKKTFDYSSTGNMLSIPFMTELRHAFVTGKYAIGIAAQAQTNHSLNQRQPMYIDPERVSMSDDVDKHWLGDAEIKFEQYNKIDIDGKMYPTLSFIKNAIGENISDLISQFIDGYVDISKGPWIMEMGATPNVAGTWMFLTKLGVPIDTVGYFMNQPIVRDYLLSIEKAGYSYLFMDDFVSAAKANYQTSSTNQVTAIPSETALGKMVGNTELTEDQKAEQQFILDEFLKYAKMAEHLFLVAQGSNYDTATFNDPYLVFKKQIQLERAQRSIFTSVDDLLENSFIGKLRELTSDVRNALAQTVLKSDEPTRVRSVVQKVLRPYVNMNDRDFVKVAQTVVSNLFDWAVQIDSGLNSRIKTILIGTEDNKTAAAGEVMDYVNAIKENDKHPLYNNYAVELFSSKYAQSEGKVNNLIVKNKDNQVYNQNQLIYAFEEIKADNPEIYGKMVRLAVLQSGLTNSGISFTFLLPYQDFKAIYNKTLSVIEEFGNLDDFYSMNVFERNNWNNSDMVPHVRANWIQSKKNNRWYYNPAMSFLDKGVKAAMNEGTVPQLLQLSPYGAAADKDVIVYSWEEGSKAEKKAMRAANDYSYIKKGLFKRVYQGGTPLTHTYTNAEGVPRENYVYKMMNAWGQAMNANEFYIGPRASVIENGFEKVFASSVVTEPSKGIFFTTRTSDEVSDDPVVSLYNNTPLPTATNELIENPVAEPQPAASVEVLLTKLGAKKVSKGMLNIDGQHWFLDKKYWSMMSKPGGTELFIYPDTVSNDDVYEISIAFKKDGEKTFRSDLSSDDLADVQTYLARTTESTQVNDETKTPIEGLNKRLLSYGDANIVLSSDFFAGEKPIGKLNGFKTLLSQIRDNMLILADVNWESFDFITKEDVKKLNSLKPLAEELDTINMFQISKKDTRTVAVEKRFAQLSNQLANNIVDILGKYVEQKLGKKITASQSRISTEQTDNWQEEDNTCTNPIG